MIKRFYCYISREFLPAKKFDLSEVPMDEKIKLLIEECSKIGTDLIEFKAEELPGNEIGEADTTVL